MLPLMSAWLAVGGEVLAMEVLCTNSAIKHNEISCLNIVHLIMRISAVPKGLNPQRHYQNGRHLVLQ